LRASGIDERTPIDAVTLDQNGIRLDFSAGKFLLFCPTDWAAWWGGRDPLSGEAACLAWSEWLAKRREHNAQVLLAKIKAGEITFLDAREQWPELFDHPRVQGALAAAFVADRHHQRKRGKRAKIPESTWRLYAWASLYYARRMEDSWEMACERACEKHPDLVPPGWGADPGGNLKRLATRELDRDYKRSQARYRRDR